MKNVSQPDCSTPEVLQELASASGGVNLDACKEDWDTFYQALAQLSVARLTPLVTRRSPPHAREAGPGRRERLARAGRDFSR